MNSFCIPHGSFGILVAVAGSVTSAASAQTAWLRASPALAPSARSSFGLAADAARDRIVLFGGRDDTSPAMDDTWEWNGNDWAQLAPSTAPPARRALSMAWDPAARRVLVFGGTDDQTTFGDTWSFDGAAWTASATSGPPARRLAGVSSDTDRDRVVLFGGQDASGALLGDTWEWDGNAWSQVATAVAPAPRRYHAMAYDPARGETILFGGIDAAGTPFRDTWAFDGIRWTQRGFTGPPARSRHDLAFDEVRVRVVLFGGDDGTAILGDTWEWDGARWIELQPSGAPAPRRRHAMAWDSVRRETVMFGGFNDRYFAGTWLFASTCAPVFTTFGAGCAGASGTPTVAEARFRNAWVGGVFELAITDLPAAGPVFVAFGTSNTAWAGGGLPFELSSIGMPGCSLLVDPEFTDRAERSGGAARYTVALPFVRSLCGSIFYVQGFALDTPANPLGLTASNAAAVTLGVR